MEDKIRMKIDIPIDNDGYVLLQCGYCGTYFKIKVDYWDDDTILDIYCPSCGLVSDCYFTPDVIELALRMSKNVAYDILYDSMKELEKMSNDLFSFKVESLNTNEYEMPIRTGIEMLELSGFPCCHRSAKVKPLLKMTGCYCPYCGVKNYEVE